ncbi:iron-containing alcohol dehydrogenase [Steroidobacter sp.]|uniref:iron-containing alcohol dehydrogenase n=1 Tax=Steroidobacter sp. TaxID=1978227 RepID=UPI001A4956C1|nr:iron-containing alcohol dehydrogenase [Steroidobacter sp.]MBL8267218.1 iron-containing alcohol dehydrogenase [Steroidobacter sp.]
MNEVLEFMWRDAGIASFECPTKIVFGVGAHERLASVLQERAVKRLLVLLDPALSDSAIYRKVTDLLTRSDIATQVFSAIDTGDTDRTVQAAFESGRERRVEALLAIGGSSTVDVAKAVGLLTPTLPVIAIPTAAGAGSAVSNACAVSILDPLTVSAMPADLAAQAGMHAFVHAFESFLSQRATVFSDALNLHAMTLLAGSVRGFVADRTNESAALDMLCGSSLAAMSLNVTGLGNVHSMATSVGALFPVSQGLAHAVCLPHAAAINVSASPERYARVAAILGIDGTGRSEARRAAQAIHGLRALCGDLGIPPRLRDIGVTEDQLDELARRSFAANSNCNNPRDSSEQDFRNLFRAAF